MSFAAVLLTPFALLFPAAGVIEPREPYEAPPYEVPGAAVGEHPPGRVEARPSAPAESRRWVSSEVVETFRIQPQTQARIEQQMTIRITPQSRPVTMPPQFMMDLPRREMTSRLVERNIGRCVPVSSISGVQPDNGGRLILFLRDRRMISAVLERACRA